MADFRPFFTHSTEADEVPGVKADFYNGLLKHGTHLAVMAMQIQTDNVRDLIRPLRGLYHFANLAIKYRLYGFSRLLFASIWSFAKNFPLSVTPTTYIEISHALGCLECNRKNYTRAALFHVEAIRAKRAFVDADTDLIAAISRISVGILALYLDPERKKGFVKRNLLSGISFFREKCVFDDLYYPTIVCGYSSACHVLYGDNELDRTLSVIDEYRMFAEKYKAGVKSEACLRQARDDEARIALIEIYSCRDLGDGEKAHAICNEFLKKHSTGSTAHEREIISMVECIMKETRAGGVFYRATGNADFKEM